MANSLKLQLVAPDKPAISAEASLVVIPGEMGEFGVMARHMSFLSTLKPGTLRITKGAERQLFFLAGGFVEVNPSSVIVLAEDYEPAGEIDVESAKKAKAHALEQLSEKKEGTDLEAVKRVLARAEARLKTAEEAKALKK